MHSLKNLYEMKQQKEALIKSYSEEHDWEIGYQRYYDFLVNVFYEFLDERLNNYGKEAIWMIETLYAEKIIIPYDHLVANFIVNFIKFYNLGETILQSSEDGKDYLKIQFKDISINDAFNSFYNELQCIERSMKSKEEMDQDFIRFQKKCQSWIERKRLEESRKLVESDFSYEKYYEFLYILKNRLEEFRFIPINVNNTMYFIINKTECREGYDCIKAFVSDYHLGECSYNDGMLCVKFTVFPKDIESAYYMERQRLQYFIETGKSRIRVQN